MPSTHVEPESKLALVHPALVFFYKDFSQFGLIQAGGMCNINKQKHNNDCLLLITSNEQMMMIIT